MANGFENVTLRVSIVGQELSDLDFTLLVVKTHVVSGRLLGQKDGSAGDRSVELVAVDVRVGSLPAASECRSGRPVSDPKRGSG
jgi:hypothetical protein